MPNRIIKESIKRSPEIDGLSWFEEVLFYRLIVTVDDYGCYDGRTVVLKNDLFPTKESVTKKAIEDAISKLASVGLVCRYEANGSPYLCLPTWRIHQRLRKSVRRFPEPPVEATQKNPPQVAASCGDSPQTAAEMCGESESNPNPNPNPNPNSTREAAFDVFWNAYPKKVGKEAARKAFSKVHAPIDALITAIEAQKRSPQWTKDNGQYIPYPAKWLNQGYWENEPLAPKEGQRFVYDYGDCEGSL